MIGIMCSEVHKSESLTALSRVRIIFKVSQILLEGSRTNYGSPALQICNLSTQSTLSSSRKYPYSPHKRDWNFQEMGFCLTKVYQKKSIGISRGVGGRVLEKNLFCGGRLFSWSMHWTMNQEVVLSPGWGHSVVAFFGQDASSHYKGVNRYQWLICLGVTLWWSSISSMGESNYYQLFQYMLAYLEITEN